MSYTAVGSAYTGTGTGSPLSVLSVNPTAVGDVLVVWVAGNSSLAAPSVSSLSHTGVTTWNKLVANANTTDDAEIWWGVVTATGSATLTITFSGNNNCEAAVLQFHSSTGGTWTADATTGAGTIAATSGNYPSVTPAASGELMLACTSGSFATASQTMSGSTTGFTYAWLGQNVASRTHGVQYVYDLNAGSGAQSPNWTATGSGASGAQVDGFLYTVASVTPHPVHISPVAALRASNF